MSHISNLSGQRSDVSTKPPEYAVIPNAVLGLFLAFVIFLYLQGGFRVPALGAIRFEALTGIVLLVAAFVVRKPEPTRSRQRTQSSSVVPWITALFVLMLIHVVVSADTALSWKIFVDRVFKFVLFGFMISSFVTNPFALKLFTATYLLAFLKMTQEGILGYFTGSLVWENQGTPRLHGSTPSYFHPNSFSGTQLGTLPIIVAMWRSAPVWGKLILVAQAIGAILVALFTGSRTGYVAAAVWIAYIFYRAKSKFRTLVLAAAIGIVIIPLVPAEYTDRFSTIFSQQDKEGASIDMRKEIYTDAWSIFVQHPLGVGVGAFPVIRERTFGRSQDTHNLYLEIGTNLGIPGLIVFLGFVVSMVRSLRRIEVQAANCSARLAARYNHERLATDSNARSHIQDLQLLQAIAAGLIGFLIIRLALGLFGHDMYEIYWWFAAGLTLALEKILRTARERTCWLEAAEPLTITPLPPSHDPAVRTVRQQGVSH